MATTNEVAIEPYRPFRLRFDGAAMLREMFDERVVERRFVNIGDAAKFPRNAMIAVSKYVANIRENIIGYGDWFDGFASVG